jgi:hypothetical protein
MLAIENAEMGGTLIALSIPGLKPLWDRLFSRPAKSAGRVDPAAFTVLNPSDVFRSDAAPAGMTSLNASELFRSEIDSASITAPHSRHSWLEHGATIPHYQIAAEADPSIAAWQMRLHSFSSGDKPG